MLDFSVEKDATYEPHYKTIEEYLTKQIHVRDQDKARETSPSWHEISTATECILKNVDSNYYTAYEVRAQCILDQGDKDVALLVNELDFCNDMQQDDQKSFGLWCHRRLITCKVLHLPLRSHLDNIEFIHSELVQLEFLFQKELMDRKNHSTWTHRIFLFEQLTLIAQRAKKDESIVGPIHKMMKEEVMSIREKLEKIDLFNNSVWAFRQGLYRLRRSLTLEDGLYTEAELENEWYQEMISTAECIVLRPNNESGWDYLLALYQSDDDDTNALRLPQMTSVTFPCDYLRPLLDAAFVFEDKLKRLLKNCLAIA